MSPDEIHPETLQERAFPFSRAEILITLLILGLFTSVMNHYRLKGLQAAREATCNSNLDQIRFALATYLDRYDCYPPAYLTDDDGRPMHSWRILLAEDLADEVYAAYRFDEPWNGPHNRTLAGRMPDYFRCPNEGRTDEGWTSYYMVVGSDAVGRPGEPIRIKDIPDGPSRTIFIAEAVEARTCWLEPRELELGGRRSGIEARGLEAISGHHPSGPGFVFADLSRAQIDQSSLTPAVLQALGTRNGGEAIDGGIFRRPSASAWGTR